MSYLPTFQAGLALVDFLLEPVSEAGFVYRLSEIVALAFAQAHRFATDHAEDGDKTLFH